MKSEKLKYTLFLAALGALFFIPFLGGVHLFDWDEINFAEAAREMIVLKDYLRVHINFEPFWEKPPLFFWLQVLSMQEFGVGEFAARLPNAICGMITLGLLFNVGVRLKDVRFGLIWALAYFGSILPHLYFKSGIIDPWFNLFIYLGLYFFIRFYWGKEGLEERKNSFLIYSGLFLGLAVLTKGPVALIITGGVMGVYWVYKKFRFYVSPLHFLVLGLVAVAVPAVWFGIETARNGFWFTETFITYQYRLFSTPDAGHGGFPGYHVMVLLIGCFPASIFAVRAFFNASPKMDAKERDMRVWMIILFWVVLILFMIVKSKIVHYSSMCYFPLTYLAARTIDRILDGEIEFAKWMKILMGVIAGLYVTALIAAPLIGQNIDMIKPLVKDAFTLANLDADVKWTGFEIIPGLLLLGVVIYFLRASSKDQRNIRPYYALFALMGVFVMSTLIFYIKRIEGYSQRAEIEFFKERQGEDCFILTPSYKTYADLFYARKRPTGVTNEEVWEEFFKGNATRQIYVVTKVHKSPRFDELNGLEKIGEKNGWVFYRSTLPIKE